MTTFAIIGAGLAGLAAARRLQAAGHAVRLFDKGRAPGGRLATRRVSHAGAEHRFDHGAQYLRATGDSFAAALDAAGAQPWPDAARRVGVPGMSALPRAWAEGLDITLGFQVGALKRGPAGWQLDGAGPYDAVLVTVPALQAAPLLPGFDLGAIRYAPCWTVLAAFAQPLPRPDTQRDNGAIGWAARDSAKPGRDAAQHNWVIQAGPEWSRHHLEATPEAAATALLAEFAARAEPLFATAHRWRFSLLESPLGTPCLWDPAQGLGYASDGCLGGRGEAAWDSGEALAARILDT